MLQDPWAWLNSAPGLTLWSPVSSVVSEFRPLPDPFDSAEEKTIYHEEHEVSRRILMAESISCNFACAAGCQIDHYQTFTAKTRAFPPRRPHLERRVSSPGIPSLES
jgi:hypothetical protein